MKMFFKYCFIIVTLSLLTSGLKILTVFPHRGKSHFLAFKPMLEALAEKGHEVTVLGHTPQEKPLKNYKDVILGSKVRLESIDISTAILSSKSEIYKMVLELFTTGLNKCEEGLLSPGYQEFIAENVQYDLILMEFFNSDCFLGLAHKMKLPVIGLTASVPLPWYYDQLSIPSNPSYIPNVFLNYTDQIPFFGRVENTVFYIYANLMHSVSILLQNRIARKHFGNDLPDLKSILQEHTRLFLVNTHFSLNLPRPLPPGVVEIGGIGLRKTKQVPKNIEKWINESTHGVIYFSLGSMIKGHTFPEEKRRIFLRAFGRLPQRVLWKWENETMPGKPDNVMIQKWMPQFDILCHPNVKAFIAHGGLLGTTEAVHCGVPAVVMPQYGDQHTNARAWEANGAAVVLQLKDVTDENLAEALNTVLDPKFKKQAEELSFRFRDRPMSPLDTAIYWVEYVARHKGARHLQTAAVGMPYYKYLLLDVIAFLAIVLALIAYVNYIVWRKILGMIFGRKGKVKTS